MNERAEQRLLVGCLLGDSANLRLQLILVGWTVVGQRVAFEIGPPIFVGIEFWGVSRQILQANPTTPRQPVPQQTASVCAQPVPYHNHPVGQVTQQVSQKHDNLLLANRRVLVELQVPAQVPASGRNTQGSNCRDTPIVASSLAQYRCAAARGPGAVDKRMQQKARLVDEYDVGLVPGRPPFDPGPVVSDPPPDSGFIPLNRSAFGLLRGKNPTTLTALGCGRHGSVRRSVARSAALRAGTSTNPCQNRMPTLPSAGIWPSHVSVGRSASTADPARVWRPGPSRLVAGRHGPSGRHFAGWFSASRRSRRARSPAASAPRPGIAAAPTALDFHEVSCLITSASHAY
jgi:hypothetical protein